MRSPQSLTQRLVPALAVTLVATLVLGAVVVTADVADGTEPLLPESFAVAAPRQGDAWRYNVTLSGDWTFGGEDEVTLDAAMPYGQFQWAGAATVRGGDGRMHDVNRLQTQRLAYRPLWFVTEEEYQASGAPLPPLQQGASPQNSTVLPNPSPYWVQSDGSGWVQAGAHTIVSRGELESDNETNTNFGFLPPPASLGVGASYEKSFMEVGHVSYPKDEVPCLVFNPLQGNNVSLASTIGLFDACSLGGSFLPIPDGLAFRAAKVETVQGVQAIRFDGQLNGTYSVWFTPAVPYPVRIAFSLPSERTGVIEEGEVDAPGARSAVLEMVGFAAGTEDLDLADDAGDALAAPGLVPAPWLEISGTRVGPDESGVEHPFPLSVAFQQALDSLTFADLRTYLSAHPDAYVAFALYGEGRFTSNGAGSEFGDSRGWSIALSDGQSEEPFFFQVVQQSFGGFVPLAARKDQVNDTQPPLYTFERDYGYGGILDWKDGLYPSQTPAQLPTARSLIDRWSAFDGSLQEGNTWGFAIGCAEWSNDDECTPQVQFLAGVVRSNQGGALQGPQSIPLPFALPGNPYGTEQQIEVIRYVTFDGAGMADEQIVEDYRSYRSDAQSTLPSDPTPGPTFGEDRDAGYDVRSTEVTGMPSSSLSWVPAPEKAASIGFLGLVVGALYWVWPKLGMVGLFSRLHRGELLDHPARAKLVQIVESQPGIHFHDLAQKAELANGTAVHHLRKLSDSGHLSVRRSGRYTCYFPGGRVDPHTAAAAPLLKSDGAKLVLDAVRGKPGMSNLELAQATGLQPSTVNYHVQRLSAAGLVAALRDGRSVRLHPGIRAGGEPPAAAA
ncbi:MAG: winged helix-turn-helix transcriptional regulator [Candidatus Thermoplasmatota archaeon]